MDIIDQTTNELARLVSIIASGKRIVRQCRHIRNHCQGIQELNALQQRSYQVAHDDNILVLVDRMGRIINDAEFQPSVPSDLLASMRSCISQMRQTLAMRMMAEQAGAAPARQALKRVA